MPACCAQHRHILCGSAPCKSDSDSVSASFQTSCTTPPSPIPTLLPRSACHLSQACSDPTRRRRQQQPGNPTRGAARRLASHAQRRRPAAGRAPMDGRSTSCPSASLAAPQFQATCAQ
eukprot:364870-Chlamydomonas_euryale.AAC.4